MTAIFRIVWDAAASFADDDGSALAGHIAFSTLLGLFPFVILASNIAALVLGEDRGAEAIDQLFLYAPEHIAKTLEPVLRGVLQGSSGSLLTLSAMIAVWFSSNAFEALRTGFDRAYGGSSHGWFAGRIRSIFSVFIAVIVALVLSVTIILGPLLINVLEATLAIELPWVTVLVRYGAGLTVFGIFLLFLHRTLPGHGLRIGALVPGVVVSALIWVVAATGFSIYLAYTPTYASTYGALAGVVITLMFFYITAMAVLFGAELNAVLERQRKGN